MGISINEAFPSHWLKAEDLKNKKVKVTIDNVELEAVGDGQKPVAYFLGKEKGLVLNKTNASTIAFHYGDDTDGWIGKEVHLYQAMVSFQGKTVPSIRVEVPLEVATDDTEPPF